MHQRPSHLIELPEELSDEAAAALVAFLHELACHAESAYLGQLRRYYEPSNHGWDAERQFDLWEDTDRETPF